MPPPAAAQPSHSAPSRRRFLMLQGPHGPFLSRLAARLRAGGHRVWRVGFNRADQLFWGDRASYIPFRDRPEVWPEACADLIARHAITDLVLYGDARPIHAQAVALARARGLRVHVLEEGYMRPYWITCEPGGANGHSPLMQVSIAQMEQALGASATEVALPPAGWGELRHHVFYGAAYHFVVMVANRGYPHFRPHRALGIATEFALSLRRMLRMPIDAIARRIVQRRIRQGGFPYHVALLQLDHDASFRSHSPFASTAAFIDVCCRAFAQSAPADHHLVFKAHPLDDDRVPCAKVVAEAATRAGIAARVHFLPSGPLGVLLDGARSGVTVNSTAAQQVLWRGLPLKAVGRAVYCKPGLVSGQPLMDFFRAPDPPDPKACRIFRRFLLRTSQVPGGYYSARGRALALGRVADMLLAERDAYATLLNPTPAPPVAPKG